MPYQKTVISTIPDPSTLHYFQTTESKQIFRLIVELSRAYKDKIIAYEKYKDRTTVITKTTYESKQISDEFDAIIYQTFPDYQAQRDAYNSQHNITFTMSGKEVD